MVSTRNVLAAIAVSLPACLAQTSTDCNPTEKSCPADPALSSSTFSSTWTSSSSLGDSWTTTAGDITFGDDGALFTINKAGDAPTIQSDFYIFFGSLEVTMKAASGQGIVSSIVLLSDDLDEVDWEFTGTDTTQVQSNYYGKGNTTTYDRAVWQTVATPQATEHTYLINWTKDSITWSIDGTLVRTLAYADANGGDNFPQTPMRVRLGPWAGGAAGNAEGTIEWAGGETDFSQAPFTMSVSSVKVTNYSPGSEYKYTDESGSYDSIQVVDGSSSDTSASAGIFAPSQTSSGASSSSTTVAAGTTVKQSSTSVASSIRASTVTTGAQLTTIPLQASTTSSSRSSGAISTGTAGTTGSSSGSNSNGTTSSTSPSASTSQTDTSAAVIVSSNVNAIVGLAVFVVAALVLV